MRSHTNIHANEQECVHIDLIKILSYKKTDTHYKYEDKIRIGTKSYFEAIFHASKRYDSLGFVQ